MKELYVVNCCRTAVGSFGGSLKNTPAAELGAIVVKEALKRANVAPENVDELMFGCILTSGLGQNVARQVGVGAGLPYSVPAYTVGMVCGSGMKSVIEAGRAILAGDADIIVCGGTENMSAAPYASTDARWGARMGDKKLVDTMIKDGLWDAFNNYHMGTTAENICDVASPARSLTPSALPPSRRPRPRRLPAALMPRSFPFPSRSRRRSSSSRRMSSPVPAPRPRVLPSSRARSRSVPRALRTRSSTPSSPPRSMRRIPASTFSA